MTIEELKALCLAQPEAIETQPFGDGALVYKVMGRMFALVATDTPARISLKCDPDEAILLRETYHAVQPGYHMNKKHWNTVICDDGEIPEARITGMIEDSYGLVVSKLKKSEREALAQRVRLAKKTGQSDSQES